MSTIVSLPPCLKVLSDRVAEGSTSVPPLQATKPFDSTLTSEIDAYARRASPHKPCVRAALHLLNDDVDRAHKIAQDDEGDMSSNLCHAILHRREGDFWNAKWWYRQIQHPLIKDFYGSTTLAQAFVDAVESVVAGKKGASTPCAARNLDQLKRRQADELANVLAYVLSQHVDPSA